MELGADSSGFPRRTGVRRKLSILAGFTTACVTNARTARNAKKGKNGTYKARHQSQPSAKCHACHPECTSMLPSAMGVHKLCVCVTQLCGRRQEAGGGRSAQAKTTRRIENRAYSDAHFMLIGFSMVRKCHWHCSETTIFSIIIFVQQDKTVLKLVTNFDTCLCFASAKRVFFARDLRRQKFAGCIFKLPVGISLLLSLL